MAETLERLTEIAREYSGDDTITITEDTALIADLGLNSLDVVNLACAVEDAFDVEVPDSAIKDLRTIGDVVAFIQAQ